MSDQAGPPPGGPHLFGPDDRLLIGEIARRALLISKAPGLDAPIEAATADEGVVAVQDAIATLSARRREAISLLALIVRSGLEDHPAARSARMTMITLAESDGELISRLREQERRLVLAHIPDGARRR